MKKITLLLTVLAIITSCKTLYNTKPNTADTKHEMRALWVSSILNLDFPSSNKLTSAQQKAEFVKLLDSMQQYNFNTVIVQIRPAGDALYPSDYEPWSSVLTGKQGEAPTPYYDPLAFMIEESHKRNIDFHAWLNPYRALFNYKKARVTQNHPANQHPEWLVFYGQHAYYNPGLPETRHFIAKVVGDITRRYDIDAIHMDDYFYPYKIPNLDFPDEKAFAEHNRGFTSTQKEDWRRDNVNLIIKELKDTIQNIKPWVQLGISPFGVWRNASKDPKGSKTNAGQTNYDDLYADILLWDQQKWVDYIVPQIYWHIGHPAADYATIATWWNDNIKHAHLYTGHALYKINHGGNYLAWNTGNEITKQLAYNKAKNKIKGNVFFRSKIFETEPLRGLKDSLKNSYYAKLALPLKTKIKTINFAPILDIEKQNDNTYKLSWLCENGEEENALKYYLVYMFEGKRRVGDMDNTRSIIGITKKNEFILNTNSKQKRRKRTFVVTRVNKANQESVISNVIYKKF